LPALSSAPRSGGIAQDCLACDSSLSHTHSLIRIPNCCVSQWTDLASQKKINHTHDAYALGWKDRGEVEEGVK
jgi:hypothetical protein